MDQKTYISVMFDFQHIHRWKVAPANWRYLREYHNHKFICTLKISVTHKNRELSFEQLKQFIDNQIIPLYQNKYSEDSCEAMATDILKLARKEYGVKRSYTVIVSEDGFAGAEVCL